MMCLQSRPSSATSRRPDDELLPAEPVLYDAIGSNASVRADIHHGDCFPEADFPVLIEYCGSSLQPQLLRQARDSHRSRLLRKMLRIYFRHNDNFWQPGRISLAGCDSRNSQPALDGAMAWTLRRS
jgi:hypothetical protein